MKTFAKFLNICEHYQQLPKDSQEKELQNRERGQNRWESGTLQRGSVGQSLYIKF